MTLLASLLLERSGRAHCCSIVVHQWLQNYCRLFASGTQHGAARNSGSGNSINRSPPSGGGGSSSTAAVATTTQPSNTTTNTNQRVFLSSFDGDCALYVSRLLENFPVTLKHTEQYGMGLFASRDIQPDAEVLLEDPAFPFTSNVMNKLEQAVAATSPDVEITADSLAVAAMVERVVTETSSPSSTCRPSTFLPIRCLGSVPGQPHDLLEEAFTLIGKAYNLPETIWTIEECRLLHDKVTTNMFTMIDTELYIAISMINHSCCDANVAWSSSDPLRSLVASRPIGKGEQIFYNYAADHADPIERHAFLLDTFGFHCTCSVCRTVGLADD